MESQDTSNILPDISKSEVLATIDTTQVEIKQDVTISAELGLVVRESKEADPVAKKKGQGERSRTSRVGKKQASTRSDSSNHKRESSAPPAIESQRSRDLNLSTNYRDYEIQVLIGQGAFGSV